MLRNFLQVLIVVGLLLFSSRVLEGAEAPLPDLKPATSSSSVGEDTKDSDSQSDQRCEERYFFGPERPLTFETTGAELYGQMSVNSNWFAWSRNGKAIRVARVTDPSKNYEIFTGHSFARPIGFSSHRTDENVLVFQADTAARPGCVDIWAVSMANRSYALQLNTVSGHVLHARQHITTAVLSPDGRRVVYSAHPATECGGQTAPPEALNAYSAVVTVYYQELLENRLTIHYPVNGADGSGVKHTPTYEFAKDRVIFTVKDTSGAQLVSVRTNGGDYLILNEYPISGYILSQTAARVAWAEAASLQIYSTDVGGHQVAAELGKGNGRSWSVSADGSTLLYLDFAGVGTNPYSVVPFRGGNSRIVSGEFQFGSLDDSPSNPLSAISPNGKWVVYAAFTLSCTDRGFYGLKVYSVSALGNNLKHLTPFFECANRSRGADGGVRITPDGRRVLFAMNTELDKPSYHLYTAPLDDAGATTLVNTQCPDHTCLESPEEGPNNFFFSANSRYVFYGAHRSGQNIYYAPTRGTWTPVRLNEFIAKDDGPDESGNAPFFDETNTHIVYNYQPKNGGPNEQDYALNFYTRDVSSNCLTG